MALLLFYDTADGCLGALPMSIEMSDWSASSDVTLLLVNLSLFFWFDDAVSLLYCFESSFCREADWMNAGFSAGFSCSGVLRAAFG